MARLQNGGQASFEDKPLMSQEIAGACEALLENKDAASAYRKANALLKELLPGVDEPTRFIIGESYFITANPYDVEGHDVKGGHRQRLRVSDQSSG